MRQPFERVKHSPESAAYLRLVVFVVVACSGVFLAPTAKGQFQPDGTCERLLSYELGKLRLTNLRNATKCYGPVIETQGVRTQVITIRTSGRPSVGTFAYGPDDHPLLRGAMTHLAIDAVADAAGGLTIQPNGFDATVRIAQYAIAPVLDGQVTLPTYKVWLENKTPLTIAPEGSAWRSTGLLEFDTTDPVVITEARLQISNIGETLTPTFKNMGAIRLGMDLTGASLVVRSGTFTAAPPPAGPFRVTTDLGTLSIADVRSGNLSLAVSPISYVATLPRFSASVSGGLKLNGVTPALVAGRWSADALRANAPRDSEGTSVFSFSDVVNNRFVSSTTAAEVNKNGGAAWTKLLASIGWINPADQRERAIASARAQLAAQSKPSVYVLLRAADLKDALARWLEDITIRIPVTIDFEQQALHVTRSPGVPVPIDFDLYLALSIEGDQLAIWPAVPVTVIGASDSHGSRPLADLWDEVIRRASDYLRHLTAAPIRLPLPTIVPADFNLRNVAAEPSPGGPPFTVKVTQSGSTPVLKYEKPVLFIAADGVRLLTELGVQ